MFLHLLVPVMFNPQPKNPNFLNDLNKIAKTMPAIHAKGGPMPALRDFLVPRKLTYSLSVKLVTGTLTKNGVAIPYRMYSYSAWDKSEQRFSQYDEAFKGFLHPQAAKLIRPLMELIAMEESGGRTKVYLSKYETMREDGTYKGNAIGEVGLIQMSTADSIGPRYQELLMDPLWAWRAGYEHLAKASTQSMWPQMQDDLRPLFALAYYANTHPQVVRTFSRAKIDATSSKEVRQLLTTALSGFGNRAGFIKIISEHYPATLREMRTIATSSSDNGDKSLADSFPAVFHPQTKLHEANAHAFTPSHASRGRSDALVDR